MSFFITRRHLSRRAVLRGAGALLALPRLDAMTPALTPERDGPLRSVFVFSPNGKKMDDWTPKNAGKDFELPYLLAPLAPNRSALTVITGLAIDGGFAHGDGPGDHARAAASFLTCAHPRKTGGADIQAGISADQIIASRMVDRTRFSSLELGTESGRLSGNCDSGYSCAYTNNISWRSKTTPNAKETSPRELFRRLFGDPDQARDAAQQARKKRRRALILDLVSDDAKALNRRLGAKDREKLGEYLDAVHALDQQTKTSEEKQGLALPDGLADRVRDNAFAASVRVFYELIRVAFEADLTRTVTFMLGNAGSNRSYRFLDIPEGHHTLSHHKNDPMKLEQIRKINRFHVEEFARFIQALGQSKDGDRSLLERSQIVYGSALGDGNRHNHDDLPFLLLGHANGKLRPGEHLVVKKRTPAANLYLSMIQNTGIPESGFADATGPLF